MNKITLFASFALMFISSIVFSQNERIEFKPRSADFEYFEYRNDSIFSLKTPIQNTTSRVFESKLPYPIIFIHGLNSSSETWNTSTDYYDTQYGFTFGGRFDFCLNADNNNTTTNKNFYPTAGADIAAFESLVQNGDYYYVNFNVNPNGAVGTTVLSNQSAIAKQGTAVRVAVQRVMEVTGKDKVILVGHSMGGLASREYIQNSYNWQSDNQHHVAKLLTLGTPHGGSNASDNPIAFFTSVSPQSEAIRDLKTTYYYSGEGSHFLFGGLEVQNSASMNDNSNSPDFFNSDINCNGILGENIQGLNQKPIDNLIDFSCVIGRITNAFGSNVTTDGVVPEPSSNMNTYLTGLTYPAKLFYFNSGYDLIENHTELPGYPYQMMQGLDEPNFKELAYGIQTNKNYIGYTTVQNPTGADNDYFKFTVTDNVNAIVNVSSIVTSAMNGTILNSAGTAVGASQNNSGATISFTRTLAPGDYYLKLTSTNPTNTNYTTPYQFNITTTLSADDTSFESFVFYPNPVKDILNLENITLSKATVYSVLGQLIETKTFENATSNTLDLSSLESGIYLIVLENDSLQKTIKVIKE
ncbi:MAG: alpha/beta fold hydrolase [Flavobacterium sp.]|uniref:alpha/beta fold hydrolase n=1 Tax=Flavobacterium sp. TaxID=239 RepID=UPI0025BF0732|nr:alpha/beta fold hydrolase [Flavobacterium sp.]MCA1965950.1 alpha/beta fold hydrolase [Flavobacterium sp.]